MKKFILAISSLCLIFASCRKAPRFASKSTSSQFAVYEDGAVEEVEMEDFAEVVAEAYSADWVNAGFGAAQNAQDAERKLIYTGYISLGVENLAETKNAVERWLEKYGGYIDNSSESQSGVRFSVNVPQENFFAAMEECVSLGKVKIKNINCRDATEQFYDLKTRLDTRHILLERLQNYLANSKDIKELIEIETKINDVTSELEHLQGNMNRLQKQISFSQIEVQANLPAGSNDSGFIFPDIKDGVRDLLGNVVSFFVNFIFVLIYVFIFGTLIVLALILIYWIAFGKIGLVRKLFDKTRK